MFARPLGALTILVLLGGALPGAASSQVHVHHPKIDEYRLMAAYFDIGALEATLMLNNKGREPLHVEIETFDLQGRAFSLRTLEVPENDFLEVRLGELIGPQPRDRRNGSLELRYVGHFLQLGAQVRHTDARTGMAFAEQLSRPREFVSSSLRGSFSMVGADDKLVWLVTNTTRAPLAVEIEIGGAQDGARLTRLDLGGRETRILDLSPTLRSGWIDVVHDGLPGDLLVRGLMLGADDAVATLVMLRDPARAALPEMHGNGLTLGSGSVLTLGLASHANEVTNVELSAVVVAGGTAYDVLLPPVAIAPGRVEDVGGLLLDAIRRRVDLDLVVSTGVRIAYSTAPGTVTGHASTWDPRSGMRIDVPLLAPGEHFSSAGIYPFRVGAGETTLFHVKNLTQQPRTHAWHVVRDGEVVYSSGYQTLRPGENLTVDLSTQQDTPGFEAKRRNLVTMHEDPILEGQVHWSFVGRGIALDARVERVDTKRGLVSSYACASCCNSTLSPEVDPEWVDAVVGQAPVSFAARQRTVDCYGNTLWIDDLFVTGVSFSGPPGVVETLFNTLECIGLGQGVAYVSIFDPFSEGFLDNPFCAPIPFPINEIPVPVQVTAAPVLNGPSSVVRNASATFSIANLVSSSIISSWKFTDGQSTVTRTASPSASTWAGNMVKTGTVSVKVIQGGQTFNLSKNVPVTKRSGFLVPPGSSVQVANRFSTFLTVTNPPVEPPSGEVAKLGKTSLQKDYTFTFTRVPSGPNKDYWYTIQITNLEEVKWVVAEDVADATSTFYQAQCGDYNAQSNPQGFISGAQLLANTRHHEGGTVVANLHLPNSHYFDYRDKQRLPLNNVGFVGEAVVGEPSLAMSVFGVKVEGVLNAVQAGLAGVLAGLPEPCGGKLEKDLNCVFKGHINFAPYQPCD